MDLNELKKEIKKFENLEQAKISQKFFKTRKGEYGEGDKFLGIKAPILRKIAKNYTNLGPGDLNKLMESRIHEHRFIALVILITRFNKSGSSEGPPKEIFEFYLDNLKEGNINNWDLVDISAPHIVGQYLLRQGLSKREVLYGLAKSKNLWERRVSIISTFTFIRGNQFDDTLKISEILLGDENDLIHKAVGWMLREVGKRDQKKLEQFLKKHNKKIPRTTLRYAIEKFPEGLRKKYLKM